MRSLVVIAAFAFVPTNAFAAEECPASLVLNVTGFSKAQADSAQRYATCMSVPWLPTANSLRTKLTECRKVRPATTRQEMKRAIGWVDHIATQLPSCETRLQIKGSPAA